MYVSGNTLRPESSRRQGLCILGATGSIGTQALEVVRLFPDRFRVRALTARANADLLGRQALEFQPECVVIAEETGRRPLQEMLSGTSVRVLCGHEGILEAAMLSEVDTVLGAVVGFAGLAPVMAALRCGKTVALANKETLVVAGAIVQDLVRQFNGRIIPVDSEHSAIFQCLAGEPAHTPEQLILTASGGPFRTRPAETFGSITRAEALKHPNWDMGDKVTIDSATLMNKGLEVIEAHWLFDIPPEKIQVLVHPQSIIHSMVTFVDGSTKAQLGMPDMKVPIQYALSYPDRWPAPHPRIDWTQLHCLDFEQPDMKRFPCLRLAFDALEMGGTAPAVLNAANEKAVALFLEERVSFTQIPSLIEAVIDTLATAQQPSLEQLIEIDAAARVRVQELVHAAAD